MRLFEALGFSWDPSTIPNTAPVRTAKAAAFRFHKSFAEYNWQAAVLSGLPFSLPSVRSLLGGVTVGGHRIDHQDQVLGLIAGSKELLQCVAFERFTLTKTRYLDFNALIMKHHAVECGIFRGEGQETRYMPTTEVGRTGLFRPSPTAEGAPQLNMMVREGIAELEQLPPFERGLAFFLFGALQQFFFSGNTQTSMLMMNGILMSNGLDAIGIHPLRVQEFNDKMANFRSTLDGTEIMAFIISCHPDFDVPAARARRHYHASDVHPLHSALRSTRKSSYSPSSTGLRQAMGFAGPLCTLKDHKIV